MKSAVVLNTADLEKVRAYLPSNYTADLSGGRVIITGHDDAGWTMEDYVLPRLASGLIFATQTGLKEGHL